MIKYKVFFSKQIIAYMLLTLLFINSAFPKDLRKIEISENFISYIFFPDPVIKAEPGIIEDIDVGSDDNVVKITPLLPLSYSTNLTVQTTKAIYAYVLKYNKNLNPSELYTTATELDVVVRNSIKQEVAKVDTISKQSQSNDLDTELEKNCASFVSEYSQSLYTEANGKGGVNLYIYPIAIKKGYMYFMLNVENKSEINYDIEGIYMSVVGKKRKAKRYVSVPNRLKVEYISNFQKQVKAKTNNTIMVYVFKKFTIDEDKLLRIQMYEKNGERSVSLYLKPKNLYNATQIK